jgi:hypothetical protein
MKTGFVKTYAPKGFRFKHLTWHDGWRYSTDAELEIIKTIPPETPVKSRDGKVINKKPEKVAPKATSKAKKTKPKKAGTKHATQSNKRQNTK